MQKISLEIDLKNNEALTEEIQKAIDGAVKSQTRKSIQKVFEAEVQRFIEAQAKRWTEKRYIRDESMIEKAVKKHIDDIIEKEIKGVELSFGDIEKRAAEKLEEKDDLLKDLLTAEIRKISIEDTVSELAKEQVQELCKHSIDESTVALVQRLSARIKELERENMTLEASVGEYRRVLRERQGTSETGNPW